MHATQLPLWANLILFALAATGLWFAGAAATRQARRIAERLGLGEAFVGMLLLGIITSLPEVATTSSAAAIGNAALAGSNLLGGVAMQMALLAAIDVFVSKRRSLTAVAKDDGLTAQAAILTLLAGLTAIGISLTALPTLAGIGVWPMLLGTVYVVAVYGLYAREKARHSSGSGNQRVEPEPRREPGAQVSSTRVAMLFVPSAIAVAIAGYVVAQSASALAEQSGISASIVGASLVAIATSLPEITTTYAAVRLGSHGMAVGNILGTNALELALFLPADAFYREGPILAALGRAELVIAILNVALGIIVIWGLNRSRARSFAGFGSDSLLVLAVYGAGMSFVYFVA